MKLLKAIDAAFTAFVDTLSPYGFPLLGDDPADALEEDSVRRRFSESWKSEPVDVPVELAGSLGAPGDGPGDSEDPPSVSPGHPNATRDQLEGVVYAIRAWMAGLDCPRSGRADLAETADLLEDIVFHMK